MRIVSYLVLALLLATGCGHEDVTTPSEPSSPSTSVSPPALAEYQPTQPPEPRPQPPQTEPAPPLVASARSQIGRTTIYDGAYVGLSYPGGDIDIKRGVCTDVVIRALRDAYDIDLQQLVHEDMKANFTKYPANWGLARPDKNIDHRRVPNLMTYFNRRGYSLTAGKKTRDFKPGDFIPGDLVTCTVSGNRPHIMIVSNKTSRAGVPLVIHNIGRGAVEEDRLFDFPITGQYRVKRP